MAGTDGKRDRIYQKHTETTGVPGFGCSTVIMIVPMVMVIAAVVLMQLLLEVSRTGYAMRALYSCTLLYIFIFALLTSASFHSVLSRYVSDMIRGKKYEQILPSYYTGLLMNLVLSALVGIPFCIHECVAGRAAVEYVFAGYCGYVLLAMVFYSMQYLLVGRDYKRILLYFLIGMSAAVLSSLILVKLCGIEVTFGMLISLDIGFLFIAALEYALIHNYFRVNSGNYKEVFPYFRKYRTLMITDTIFTLGLFIHNFVFWTTDMHVEVANSFICMTSYDMAASIAMLTNISSCVFFVFRMEKYFLVKYGAYAQAVAEGRDPKIQNAKSGMFRQLSEELIRLVRTQFIVSIVLYFISMIVLPGFGLSGIILRIYPCLAVGYFVLFIMYAVISFLYYFNDITGIMITAIVFLVVTVAGSIAATYFSEIWYGIGLLCGSFAGFSAGYGKLRRMERRDKFL